MSDKADTSAKHNVIIPLFHVPVKEKVGALQKARANLAFFMLKLRRFYDSSL